MKKLNYLALFFGAIALSACSTIEPNENLASAEERSEVAIGLPIAIASRTTVDEAGHATWSDNDKFALWADNSVGASVMSAEPFALCYYMAERNQAVFTSHVTPMAEGSYNYYAVYPVPQSVENVYTAHFTLPAEQQGDTFNGAYDIMVAEPFHGKALGGGSLNEFDLSFHHKMHTLKFTIPSGGNELRYPVTSLDIVFPTAVTGNVAINIKDAEAPLTLSSSTNTLHLTMPKGANEGDTFYAVIAPCQMNGTVYYTAHGEEGRSAITGSFEVAKRFEEGHITPVSLKIPERDAKTTLRFSIGTNYLGEAVEKITIYDHNGTSLGTFAANAANAYDIVRKGEFSDTGLAAYAGKTFRAVMESASAIVEQKFVMPTTILQYEMTTVAPITVPYLFEEDFTSLHSNFEWDDDRGLANTSVSGHLLNDYMSVSGWNVARGRGVAGQSVRVNVRHQSTLGVTRANGRLDSPAMKRLKSGANVKLKVTFDMGGYADSGYGSNNGIYCMAGVHNNSEGSALSGVNSTAAFGNVSDDASRVASQFATQGLQTGEINATHGSNGFSSSFPTYSYTVSGCTASTRLCWIPCCVQSEWIQANNAHYYIYIDNIKVSIVK